jgi:hypothetical protein
MKTKLNPELPQCLGNILMMVCFALFVYVGAIESSELSLQGKEFFTVLIVAITLVGATSQFKKLLR